VSAAGGHWTPGAQRCRRLWSALLGAILLVAGFHRRPADREAAEIPELTKGRAPGRTARKARRAWIEIARLLYSAIRSFMSNLTRYSPLHPIGTLCYLRPDWLHFRAIAPIEPRTECKRLSLSDLRLMAAPACFRSNAHALGCEYTRKPHRAVPVPGG
jgi:hypothetical protein